MKPQKSFMQNFAWAGVMLLAMGVLFAAIGFILPLALTSPDSVRVVVNGVRLPATAETLRTAHRIYWLTFGLIGLSLLLAGGVVFCRCRASRARAHRLKAEGEYLSARLIGYEPTAVRVNRRPLYRLRCAYTDNKGTTYIFKSASLRADPAPFLPGGMVDVYCDRADMSRYFVDVDGSAGLGERVFEL